MQTLVVVHLEIKEIKTISDPVKAFLEGNLCTIVKLGEEVWSKRWSIYCVKLD